MLATFQNFNKKWCSFKSKSLPWKYFTSIQSSLKSYQEMCRQLDASLASSCLLTQPEIKRCPRTPTAKSSQKTGATTGPLSRRCDSTAHVRICNKLHASALIQANIHNASCDRRPEAAAAAAVDLCHREQLFTVYNIWPWNWSSSVTSSS